MERNIRVKKMKALTVKDLKKECEKQIKMGNGDKTIMISDDDEGNGFHYLWYSFSSMTDAFIREDEVSEDVAKYEDTIILG